MNKLKKEFLTTYMDINRDGDIIFKSVLNLNIFRNNITKKDALIIIYEALSKIYVYGITEVFDLDKVIIPKLIDEFKNHRNKANLADNDVYHDEINTVIGYIKELSKNRNFNPQDIIKSNYSFLNLIDSNLRGLA